MSRPSSSIHGVYRADLELSTQEEVAVLYASKALKEDAQSTNETFGDVQEMGK